MKPSASTNASVAENGALILIVAGAAFILVGVLADRDAVSAPLVVIGATSIVLGALFSRMHEARQRAARGTPVFTATFVIVRPPRCSYPAARASDS